jgi:hypothetical protein
VDRASSESNSEQRKALLMTGEASLAVTKRWPLGLALDANCAPLRTARDANCARAAALHMGGALGYRMPMARAAISTIIIREIRDWAIMATFAPRARTAVSVGEKAVLVLKAR